MNRGCLNFLGIAMAEKLRKRSTRSRSRVLVHRCLCPEVIPSGSGHQVIMDERLMAICAELGVFLRREAEELGYHDQAIASLVKHKVWHRVRRGAYTSTRIWEALDDAGRYALLTRAALRQARADVVLSHTSALAEYGVPLWGCDFGTVHLTRLDARAGRHESGVQQHSGKLLPGEIVHRNRVPVTSGTRTALDMTTTCGTEVSIAVVDALLHAGHTTPELLGNRYALMSQWPNTLHTDLVLRLADGRSESVGETRTRYLCWRQGLPAPIPQVPIFDASGREIARVDLAWPEHGVFLEFDGKVKYEALLKEGERPSDVVVREKMREQLIIELTGWRCIRVVWADLYRPDQTAMRIRNLLFPGAIVA